MAGACHHQAEPNDEQNVSPRSKPGQTIGEQPCQPRSSFPTTAPPTRTTRSRSGACFAGAAPTCARLRAPLPGPRPRPREARPERGRGAAGARREPVGDASVARHVVTDRFDSRGLRALAEREGASAIVFCSDSHTANGNISIGNSAQQLLEGGPVAVAIAPVGLADSPEVSVRQVGRDRRRRRRRARNRWRRWLERSRDRRAGRRRAGRPAGRRLAPGGRAGPRGDQRLGGAPESRSRRARC